MSTYRGILRCWKNKDAPTTKKPKSKEQPNTKEQIMAQIFDNPGTQTRNTEGFVNFLETSILPDISVTATRPTTATEISPDKPLLVMCQKVTRIEADIDSATREIHGSGIPDNLVAVIIIHATAKHALPTQRTLDALQYTHCKNYGLLVEFAYLDGEFYKCDLNERGQKELKHFLDTHAFPCKHQSASPTASTSVGGYQPYRVEIGKYPIQFYTQPGINAQSFPEIFEDSSIQVVQSIADLHKLNVWMVIQRDDNDDEKHILSGEANITVIITIDKDIQEQHSTTDTDIQKQPSQKETIEKKLLQIRLKYGSQDKQLQEICDWVTTFINRCIHKDVSAIFNAEGNERIEVYSDTENEYLDTFLCNARHKVITSLTCFTKQDPRVLWFIVCEKNSPLITIFDQVNLANAKVILVLDDEDSAEGYTKDDSLTDSRFLLTIRARKGCLSTQAGEIKADIVEFMLTVQRKLMMGPVEKLFKHGMAFFNWLRQTVQS